MGRGKLRLELIRNDKERRMAFQKKKKALEKSAGELSVLCGVDVGMIVSDPFGESAAQSVWPPEPEVLERLLECYKAKQGCHDSGIKTYYLSDFFKDQIEKEMTEKEEESTYSLQDERISSMSGEELKYLSEFLNAKIYAVKEKINIIKASRMSETHAEEATMNPPVQESRDIYPTMWNAESGRLPLPFYDSFITPEIGMHQFADDSNIWNDENQGVPSFYNV